TLLVRCDVARITIVAVPRHSIVAVPRRTDPHAARADRAPEMRKACGADARRDRNPLWPRNRRPDHRGSESATKGHGMAASKCAPTSGGGFDRRRNQAGRENCEETGRNSNGHRKLLPTPLWSHFIPAHSVRKVERPRCRPIMEVGRPSSEPTQELLPQLMIAALRTR